jgi:hypothetical protein
MEIPTNEPKAILEIESDDLGNWEVQFPPDLAPGLHKIIVETESGDQRDMALLNLQYKTEIIVEPVQPKYDHLLLPFSLLTILVLLLAANTLRLMIKARRNKSETEKRNKNTTIVSVIAALVSVFLFVFIAYQLNWFVPNTRDAVPSQPVFDVPIKQEAAKIDVTGLVVNPLTDLSIGGMDLSSAEVNIKVEEGGAFNFTQIPSNAYIRLTHPELKKAILFAVEPDAQNAMNILFDVEMFNSLMTVIDWEAGGKLDLIYDQLPQSFRANFSEQNFIDLYESSFAQKDLRLQNMIVAKHSKLDAYTAEKYDLLFDRVVKFDLEVNNSVATYFLIHEDATWKIFK